MSKSFDEIMAENALLRNRNDVLMNALFKCANLMAAELRLSSSTDKWNLVWNTQKLLTEFREDG